MDCRLIRVGSAWNAVAASRELTGDNTWQSALLTLSGTRFTGAQKLVGPEPGIDEKNWMPFIRNGALHFVYSCNPTLIIDYDLGSGVATPIECRRQPNLSMETHGSSQGVPLSDGSYLFVVHEMYLLRQQRCYLHRLLRLDNNLAIADVSHPFTFTDAEREFCAGLAIRDGTLVMSFGRENSGAHFVAMEFERAFKLLQPLRLSRRRAAARWRGRLPGGR